MSWIKPINEYTDKRKQKIIDDNRGVQIKRVIAESPKRKLSPEQEERRTYFRRKAFRESLARSSEGPTGD